MRCHVRCSFEPHLPVEVGSNATACPAAPDLASLLRWAPALPRVPQLWNWPPWWGELWCCHVSRSPEPRLLTEVNSDAAKYPSSPDLASLLRWTPALSRVLWLRALPSWEGSSCAATCPTARGSAFLREELRCYHIPRPPAGCGPQE
jgi:hypothetical protein